jgi:hypothetical protein
MKAQIITFSILSVFAVTGQAATADSYSSTTTTRELTAPVSQYRTTTIEQAAPLNAVRTMTIEQAAPLTEVRTTTVENPVTVVRETPVFIQPSNSTVTVIKDKRKHHHLIKVPFMSID